METGLNIGKVNPPRVFHQLGILVLDGSGSMLEMGRMQLTKAQEVNSGVLELFNRLSASRVKNNFSFACIKFDTQATVTVQPTAFENWEYFNENFDPTVDKGGGTQIFDALEKANDLADSFLKSAPTDGLRTSVLILLMSDGLCFEPAKTKAVADHMKSNPKIEVAGAYFGTVGENEQAAQNLLKEVVSDPVQYYATVYDGDTLRRFFELSISQSSGAKIG